MNTPFLNSVYEQVDFDRELVFKFFTVFSLFEYALKKAGFCTAGRSGEAQPDWKGFADSISAQFENQIRPQATPELVAAIDYMVNRPVMRQALYQGSVIFTNRNRPKDRKGDDIISDTEWISILIRGVRNNLFHGGKFRYDRPRDTDLIKSSLIILEAWAHINRDVECILTNVK